MNNKYNSISPFLLTPLLPLNIITYKAPNKLEYVTSSYSSGLHTKSFGKAKLIKHTFKNGIGTLIFDKDVTIIALDAFRNSLITEINLPNSIIKLEDYAFNYCYNLTSISLGDNLEFIGNSVFYNCNLKSLIIPDSVTTLGGSNFSMYSNTSLKYVKLGKGLKNFSNYSLSMYNYDLNNPIIVEVNYDTLGTEWSYNNAYINLVMGPNVKFILDEAFRSKSCILSLTIGRNVKSIGKYAFLYNSSIKSIKIPNSVTSLGEGAFQGCSKVEELIIGNGIKVIPKDCFNNCGQNSSIKFDVVIPNSVVEILDYAFGYIGKIKNLILSKNLVNIGLCAFSYDNIEGELVIPDSVKTIGRDAFISNYITNLKLSKNLEILPLYSFQYSYELTELSVPEGVKIIGSYCFGNNSKLETVYLPSTITNIDYMAFSGCPNIIYLEEDGLKYLDLDRRCLVSISEDITTLNIGANIVSILADSSSFISTISNIEYITVDPNNPVYNSGNNCNAIIETSTNKLILGCGNTTIPSNVTSIGNNSFKNCKTLTTIEIPTSVTSLGDYCFENCTELISITIPSSVNYLGVGVFNGSAWLENLPVGPVYINNMLYTCNGELPANTSLIIEPGTIKIYSLAISHQPNLNSVTIPNTVTSIGSSAFSTCPNLTTVTINSNSFISLEFVLYNSSESVPCLNILFGNLVTKYIIGEGVTKIGEYAFYLSTNLTTIELPESLTTIDRSAFYRCTNLTAITIPEGVTTIADYTFLNCSNLTTLNLPDGLTTIGSSALSGCSKLATINFPEGLTTVSTSISSAYLGDVVLPSTLTGVNIFSGSTMDNLTIKCNSMTLDRTSSGRFSGSIRNTLTLSEGITTIGKYWFYNNIYTTLVLPSTITYLSDYAFSSCSNLTSITIKATTPPPLGINGYTFNTTSSWINAVTIYVPAESVNAYKAANGWKTYKNRIQAIPTN